MNKDIVGAVGIIRDKITGIAYKTHEAPIRGEGGSARTAIARFAGGTDADPGGFADRLGLGGQGQADREHEGRQQLRSDADQRPASGRFGQGASKVSTTRPSGSTDSRNTVKPHRLRTWRSISSALSARGRRLWR